MIQSGKYHFHSRSHLFQMGKGMFRIALRLNGGVRIFYISMDIRILPDIFVCYDTAHNIFLPDNTISYAIIISWRFRAVNCDVLLKNDKKTLTNEHSYVIMNMKYCQL